MSTSELEERPLKKRRFFVEDPEPLDPTLIGEPTLPDEVNALPESLSEARKGNGVGQANRGGQEAVDTSGRREAEADAFDAELFLSVVGEQVSASAIEKLAKLSGNDVQRGTASAGSSGASLTG